MILLQIGTFFFPALVVVCLFVTYPRGERLTPFLRVVRTVASIGTLPIALFLVHFAFTQQWTWLTNLVGGLIGGVVAVVITRAHSRRRELRRHTHHFVQ